MQDLGYEAPRIPVPRNRVNKPRPYVPIDSFRDLPARKAGTVEAAIFIFSPLCGFLPSLAFCSLT
jgi:hypothetical protein